jgi:putative sugar O-methyltransferase
MESFLKYISFFKNPLLIIGFIKQRVRKILFREYISARGNRSESDDDGLYIYAVQRAVKSYRYFSTFKKDSDYQATLEHVSKDQGEQYLDIVRKDNPHLIMRINDFKKNDLVGSPTLHHYPEIGLISPTTLRYIKVASDLLKFFGDSVGDKVVEIGAGYGGQALINDMTFKIKEYELLDLPPVLNLISKYLESHILNYGYKLSTLNQKTGEDSFDLVISNYAFSELPTHLQMKYIEKVISQCRRGYMTMNSGMGNFHPINKLSVDELRKHLPNFEIFPEYPLTGPDNYIIVWGHHRG